MKKPLFRRFRSFFMWLKVYSARTTTYLSLINAGMILFLTLSRLKELGVIDVPLEQYFFPIYIIGILGLIFIGYIEIKFLKGVQEEKRITFDLTPQFVSMKNKIDEMYEHYKNGRNTDNPNRES